MQEVGKFLGRLTSRKFLLTIFGITAVTLYPEGSTAIVTLIVTFVGAEGAADTVERYADKKFNPVVTTTPDPFNPAATTQDDEPDFMGAIVPGDGGSAPL